MCECVLSSVVLNLCDEVVPLPVHWPKCGENHVFLWRFRRNPSLWDDAVSSVRLSVCVCALGVYCWEHLELRNLANVSLGTQSWSFFKKISKSLKIGFLANFFNFFLKSGGVFLWTHVQSWNCGEIMRGCLMKIFFFEKISKISKLDPQNWILAKSRLTRDYNSGNLV